MASPGGARGAYSPTEIWEGWNFVSNWVKFRVKKKNCTLRAQIYKNFWLKPLPKKFLGTPLVTWIVTFTQKFTILSSPPNPFIHKPLSQKSKFTPKLKTIYFAFIPNINTFDYTKPKNFKFCQITQPLNIPKPNLALIPKTFKITHNPKILFISITWKCQLFQNPNLNPKLKLDPGSKWTIYLYLKY